MNFQNITNNIAVMYTLLLIVILLMYIAFYKKPGDHKKSHNK